MTKLQKNQTGFTMIEVLLVVLTLVVIGVAGYFVAKHVDSKNTALNSAATNTSNDTTKPITSTPATTTPAKPVNISSSDVSQLLTTFYSKYTTTGSSPKQVVQQYGTSNLTSYYTPQAGYSYYEDPILCTQDGGSSFIVSNITTTPTTASATITENPNSIKINSTLVEQSGSLKVDTISCNPALKASQGSP